MLKDIFLELKSQSLQQRLTTHKERAELLNKLSIAIEEHQEDICLALQKDFNKPAFETLLTEVYPVLKELQQTQNELKHWMKPKKVSTPLALWGAKSEIQYQAKGCVLIIAPWNYPFQLSIAPLIAALAAGNTAILKPSELAPATAEIIKLIINKIIPQNTTNVVIGGVHETTELLKLPFDHIFFTGSTAVGKIIMEAAAKNLTSVTLELGGKSPAIILPNADIKDAVKKITWGKFINAGQTCVAPDYVLLPAEQKNEFINLFKTNALNHFSQIKSDYAHIISPRHKERLKKLINDAEQSGSTLITLASDKADLTDTQFLPPSLLSNTNQAQQIMQEEIFGPILPIVTYDSLNEAITRINKQEKPLALYVFGQNKDLIKTILNNTSSGGVCINDTVVHLANNSLPFGGIGHSGIGNYHGLFGFKSFSHERSVMTQSKWNKTLSLFYPPYTGWKNHLLKLLIRFKI